MNWQFPRTEVAGVSLSRMVMGTNWMAGWSHTSPSSDKFITDYHGVPGNTEQVIDAYLAYGVDTIVGLFTKDVSRGIVKAVNSAREKYGRDIVMIDTPIINVDDNEAARREARAEIKKSKGTGARFCFPHHTSAEQLVNKNKGTIDRIGDYLEMIREQGMIPGLSAHMPELVVYADANGYDVESYIQIYNPIGFMMQVEIESVARIIWNAKKPVLTIKPMAAGRTTPYVGLNFSWATLRPCDMVAVGCMRPDEVHEDIEISRAAFERRYPDIEARESPANNQAAITGKK